MKPSAVSQGIPLVHVAVKEHGALVVVCRHSSRGAGDGVVDRPLGARAVELFPQRGDEVDEPTGLLGAGRQAAAPARAARLEPPARREISCRLRMGSASSSIAGPEPLEEQRTPLLVLAQESDASVAVGQAQDGDLVARHVAGSGHVQLQDRRCAVGERCFGHERLGRELVGSPDGDAPLVFKAGHELRKVAKPS